MCGAKRRMITPVFDENGVIKYVFNNVRDITGLNKVRDRQGTDLRADRG